MKSTILPSITATLFLAFAMTTRVNAAVCSESSTLEGIDVSSFDGTINWQTVATTKAFAFARVSVGSSIDPTFTANYQAIRDAGMVRGAYQFLDPTQDGVAQANLLLQKITVPLPTGDLPPALDVETTGGQSASTIASAIQAWAGTVKKAIGKPPIIYVAASLWNNEVQSPAPPGSELWISEWDVTCPTLPTAWSGWFFWQHSYKGSVGGIAGSVDLDTFNGSAEQLAAFVENDGIFNDGFDVIYSSSCMTKQDFAAIPASVIQNAPLCVPPFTANISGVATVDVCDASMCTATQSGCPASLTAGQGALSGSLDSGYTVATPLTISPITAPLAISGPLGNVICSATLTNTTATLLTGYLAERDYLGDAFIYSLDSVQTEMLSTSVSLSNCGLYSFGSALTPYALPQLQNQLNTVIAAHFPSGNVEGPGVGNTICPAP